MFTGLIDDVGRIAHVATVEAGRELRIECRYDDLAPGESIAVNGACLTVRECGPGWFTVAAIVTTLDRTTTAEWNAGQRVNLERAVRTNARLGGHIVQGHVDGVGSVAAVHRRDDAVLVDIDVPSELSELMILHGSVTVDGVSLTVNALPREGTFQISLIDYTLRHTTLGDLRANHHVQVEADVIGKYVRRLIAPYVQAHA